MSKDDLRNFQLYHFGDKQHPSESIATSGLGSRQNKSGCTNDQFDEDDGLGYYPDGVKRTLTEEQVAMFRHSEIYNLLREKRLNAETDENESEEELEVNLEAAKALDFDLGEASQSEGPLLKGSSSSSPPAASRPEQTKQVVDSDNNDDEEDYVRFLLEEKKQQLGKTSSKKRKRGIAHQDLTMDQDQTHRRAARELDIPMTGETILDYDEEPVGMKTAIPTPPTSEKEHEALSTHAQPKLEGRKIWWPTIGRG